MPEYFARFLLLTALILGAVAKHQSYLIEDDLSGTDPVETGLPKLPHPSTIPSGTRII